MRFYQLIVAFFFFFQEIAYAENLPAKKEGILKQLLQQNHLTDKLGPTAIDDLIRATIDYEDYKARLHGISGHAPIHSRPLPIPVELQKTLLQLANRVQKVIEAVQSQKPYVIMLPKHALGQLSNAQNMLQNLALGQCDPECYDIEIISQRLDYAANYLARWAADGFK